MKFSLQLVWLPPLSLEAKTIRVTATRNEESTQRQELLKEALLEGLVKWWTATFSHYILNYLYSMIVCHNQWRFKNISTQDFSPKRCKKSLPKVSPKGFAIEAVPQSADAPSHPSYIKVEELRKFALEAEEGTSVHCFFGKKSRKDSKNNLEVIDGEV